ncbi:MAG: RICIN domain-containing protein [Acidobacteria bacterium]|nr:RICIN domain-containing protein [Acidobacteriota bacterium]
MRNWIRCLAFALCGFGLLQSPNATAQQAAFTGPGRYRIENVASGKSLDVKQEDKRTVQQWATHGAAHQQWDVEDAGNGYYWLRSAADGKLLDFAENRTRDGVNLIVADKRDSDYQLWKLNDAGNGQYTIVSKTGKAIDVPATARMQDGAKLQVMGEHGLENQRFRFYRLGDLPAVAGGIRPRDRELVMRPTPTPTPALGQYSGPGRYSVQSVHSGKYLDLKLEDQETLQQWSPSGARNQQWEIEDAGGGYVYLRSGENGKALEVANSRPTDGTAVFVRNNRSNTDTQKWRIVEQGNGEYAILSRTGRVLDLAEFNQNDGAKLYVWKETRAANQRFRFARVTQGETYTGGRVRGPQPTPTPAPTPAPYTPGKLVWRGRVDIEILLDVRGGVVTERSVAGQSFNNGRILSSTGAMPLVTLFRAG